MPPVPHWKCHLTPAPPSPRPRYAEFYPSGPESSDSFGRVVSTTQAERIARLLAATRGTVVLGGTVDAPARYVAPTVVRDVRPDDALMEEELFAPVLCVLPVRDAEEAIEIINARCVCTHACEGGGRRTAGG